MYIEKHVAKHTHMHTHILGDTVSIIKSAQRQKAGAGFGLFSATATHAHMLPTHYAFDRALPGFACTLCTHITLRVVQAIFVLAYTLTRTHIECPSIYFGSAIYVVICIY